MLSNTVILAHTDMELTERMAGILGAHRPALHIERVSHGFEVLTIQSLMRVDAVLLDMNLPDMSGQHLIRELKRDIADPYIMVCAQERSMHAEQQAKRMGANSYHPLPINVMQVCEQMEAQLRMRESRGYAPYGTLEESMLQRVFRDHGIACNSEGYACLKHALQLLTSGAASLDSMRMLYERIGERVGSTAQNVERNIRYTVERCRKNAKDDGVKLTNRTFIALLLEECRSANPTLVTPRISVFSGNRRVFR